MTPPAISEARRRKLRGLLHDAKHQATARHLSEEQRAWIEALLVQALEVLRGEKEE